MSDDRGELEWTPRGGRMERDGAMGARGPRWVISVRALVVVLAMIAAALGVLWLESAGVQGATAQLSTQDAGKVAVPPLAGTATTSMNPAPAPSVSVTPAGAASAAAEQPSAAASTKAAAGTVPAGSLVVHVAGAVHHPGVFTLEAGSRVFQAVEAAGGALPTAGLGALNLAAVLTDGLQVRVPTSDEAAAMATPPGSLPQPGILAQPGGPAAAPGSTAADVPALVNLNTASAAEFETLPGVGPVLAERIVQWRASHGPFASVEGLTAVAGIGPKLLAGLQDLVIM